MTGIACLCIGLMFFSCQDAAIKFLAGDYSILQILFMRSLAATPLLALFLYFRHGLAGFKTSKGWLHFAEFC